MSDFPSPISSILDRVATQLDIVNTITETTLYSFSVPGRTLGSNKMLRLTIHCDYLNNSGATDTVRLKVKYGATTLFDSGVSSAIAASASRDAVPLALALINQNATNAQVLSGSILFSKGGATTGIGNLNTAIGILGPFGGTSAVDSTVAQTLAVTITLGTAAATISFRRNYALLELL